MSYLHITNIILAITPLNMCIFKFTKSYSDSTKIFSGFLLPYICFEQPFCLKNTIHDNILNIMYLKKVE